MRWEGELLIQLPQERLDCTTSVAKIIKGEWEETFNKNLKPTSDALESSRPVESQGERFLLCRLFDQL